MHSHDITVHNEYGAAETWTCHVSGDFNGYVQINNTLDADFDFAIPFEVMEELVGRKFQAEAIRKIEDQTGKEFLQA